MRASVRPRGPLNAKIAIVGQSPGKEEVAAGEPFVGPAGKELNRQLVAAGIDRKLVYLDNVIPVMPRGIKEFIDIDGDDVAATPQYYQYESELYERLRAVKANVIVAAGAEALYALTRHTRITKRRGSMLSPVNELQQRHKKVVPILHPSGIIRGNALGRWYSIHDLKRVKQESVMPFLDLPERTLVVEPTFEEAMDFIDGCRACEAVGFDIEVSPRRRGWEVTALSFATTPNVAMSVPFCQRNVLDYFTMAHERAIWDSVTSILEDPRVMKVMHNACFDVGFMFERMGIRTMNMADTMVAARTLEPEFPAGLDFVASIYTREPYWKDEGKRNFKLIGDDKQFWTYNAKDSAVTLDAWESMKALLDKAGLTAQYDSTMQLVHPLCYMQSRGFAVEMANLEEVRQDMTEEITQVDMKLQRVYRRDLLDMATSCRMRSWLGERDQYLTKGRLDKASGERVNRKVGAARKKELEALMSLKYSSPKQVGEYFWNVLGLPPLRNTKHKVSTDATVMQRLRAKGLEAPGLILKLREMSKLVSGYLSEETGKGTRFSEDGRLRCSYNPVGARTGRLSSSDSVMGEGMNLQNLPPAFKKFVVNDPGKALVNIDYKMGELMVVAFCGPVPELIEAFCAGIDVHALTAAGIFGKDIGDVSREKGSWLGERSERDAGKAANHSGNYGVGINAFALKYELAYHEAKRILTAHYRTYPGIRDNYQRWIEEAIRRDQTLVNPFGRKRRFRGEMDGDTFRAAWDHFAQSTIADAVNRAVKFVYEDVPEVDLQGQVHDSIVFQLDLGLGWDCIAAVLQRIAAEMEKPITWVSPADDVQRTFLVPVDVSLGRNWARLEDVRYMLPDDLRHAWEVAAT